MRTYYATSMEFGIIMAINPCRDRANFAEQLVTEGAAIYIKTVKPLVYYGHVLALPLAKE